MKDFKFSYLVGLTPVNQEIEFDFENDMISESLSVEEYIRAKLKDFSGMSQNSLRNRKYVDLDSVVIKKNEIMFTLYSEHELPVVGKAIRLLSQILLEEKYFVELLFQNKLFKTFTPIQLQKDITGETVIVDASIAISDSDFVKGLIDYLLTPQFPYSKEKNDIRNAVQEMKALAVKSGMIKL